MKDNKEVSKVKYGVRDNVGWVTANIFNQDNNVEVDANPKHAKIFDSFNDALKFMKDTPEVSQFFCAVKLS